MSSTTMTTTTILLEQEVPLEISVEEYQDLLTQVVELVSQRDDDDNNNNNDVLQEEWLYAARCGDVDVIRALWQVYSVQLLQLLSQSSSTKLLDSNGNTTLHLASANGHESTVRLLLLLSSPPTPTPHCGRMAVNQAGNTPLHWAAANGHDKIVQLLLYFNHDNNNESNDTTTTITTIDVLQKNQFGRSILTEGFTSQNEKVVQLLLEHESASEEKFLDGHDDAKNGSVTIMDIDQEGEDGGDDDGNEDDDDNDSKMEDSLTNHQDIVMTALEKDAVNHEFNLAASNLQQQLLLRICELPMQGDNPLGDTAIEDVTGYGIWCASLILARWMADLVLNDNNNSNSSNGNISNDASINHRSFSWKDHSVVELGAGCGVPGLTVACHGQARYVLLTDLNPITVQNLQYNIALNQPSSLSSTQYQVASDNSINSNQLSWSDRVQASSIDWLDRSTWPQPPLPLPLPPQQQLSSDSPQQHQKFDVVLGSDLIYQASTAPMLRNVIAGLLRPGGTFYYVAPTTTGRDGLSEFIELLQQPIESTTDVIMEENISSNNNHNDKKESIVSQFRLVAATPAPKQYHENPLGSQDEDDFFLHFHELTSSEYMLYEFEKSNTVV